MDWGKIIRMNAVKVGDVKPSVIGITGSPGTGKKTVGRIIAKALGWKLVHLNRLAISSGAVINRDRQGFTVDPEKLRAITIQVIRGRHVIVVGHLLPAILYRGEVDFVGVLRCEPMELERRLAPREYYSEKVKENVSSEILDVCLMDALQRFGSERIGEFDTTQTQAKAVAAEIVETHKGKTPRRIGRINWLSKISESELNRFFNNEI